MPILPLPQFEADLAEQDRAAYEALKPPASVVVRFGALKMVGEFPYDGDQKPGCGSKLVVRTTRGTEIGEMLTSTCPNAGCSKSVTRKEMLQYIENSGGKDYPFFSMQGRVLRVATVEDVNQQAALDSGKVQMTRQANALAQSMSLPMKIVDAEPILGQERLTFYFTSEERIDFRDLVNVLATEFKARIELRQVGARDEARLVADYERCGQHCCCKQFLKVLKPISMKSAKIQKATLDPLKISGRCGRLMCCLRYEDQTYDELRKRLPKRKTRVFTPHGWGLVMDSQILTQLVLVALENSEENVAVPVEDISTTEREYERTEPGGTGTGEDTALAEAPTDDELDDVGGERPGAPARPPQPAPGAPAGAMRPPQRPQGPRDQRDSRGQRPPQPGQPRSDRADRDRPRDDRPGGPRRDDRRREGPRDGGRPGGREGARGDRPHRGPDGRDARPRDGRPRDSEPRDPQARGQRPRDGGNPPPQGGGPRRDDPRAPGQRPDEPRPIGPDSGPPRESGGPPDQRRRRRRRRGRGGGNPGAGEGGNPGPSGGPPDSAPPTGPQ